jgi:pimeloyl-ACP methyl ester carboxylesterase
VRATRDATVGMQVRTEGKGPPLVIVPGTMMAPDSVQALLAPLTSRWRCHLVVRRGYGGSPAGPHPCRLADQVADLAAVLESIGRPSTVFGHSFGGIVGLATEAAHPGRLSRLVLYEPPLRQLGDLLVPALRRIRELLAADDLIGAVQTAFRSAAPSALRPEGLPDRVAARLTGELPGLIADLECVTGISGADPRWGRVDLPVLLMNGDRTGPGARDDVETAARLLPGATRRVLPEQGHVLSDLTGLAGLLGDWARAE